MGQCASIHSLFHRTRTYQQRVLPTIFEIVLLPRNSYLIDVCCRLCVCCRFDSDGFLLLLQLYGAVPLVNILAFRSSNGDGPWGDGHVGNIDLGTERVENGFRGSGDIDCSIVVMTDEVVVG